MAQKNRFHQKPKNIVLILRKALPFLVGLALTSPLPADVADETPVVDDSNRAETANAADRTDTAGESYAVAVCLNALLPGYSQFKRQRPAEAWVAIGALPLIGVGQYLFWSSLMDGDGTVTIDSLADQLQPRQELAFWAGRSLSLLGMGLWSASQWIAHRDELAAPEYRCAETMADLLLAPFAPETVLDEAVVFPLAAIGLVRVFTLPESTFNDFFAAGSRYALGYYWHPTVALAVRGLSAGMVAWGGAVATETLLRGLVLERSGYGASMAIQGGISLAPYLLLGSDSANSTISGGDYTVVSDLLFAAYAGAVSQRSGDPRRAIALRFWLETLLATIGYVEAIVADSDGPTEGIGFGLKVSY